MPPQSYDLAATKEFLNSILFGQILLISKYPNKVHLESGPKKQDKLKF